jgi:fructose-1,6-bisphosphatase II
VGLQSAVCSPKLIVISRSAHEVGGLDAFLRSTTGFLVMTGDPHQASSSSVRAMDAQAEVGAPPEGVSRVGPDRNLAMELVRTTEYAALACARWIGRGDKEGADGAAVDAMRMLLDTVSMDGVVVIGEGEKDEAPMLFNGEQIGDGSPPKVDIAVDPLEGTELCAKGMPNAIATIALGERGTMFDPGPCVYMLKIAASRDMAHLLDLDRPLGDTLKLMAKEKGVAVGDMVVIMLDRPRHDDAMREIREVGARIRLIPHGDVSAALVAVTQGSPVDLLYGIGGTPEGVLAAAAIQCTGGQILGRLWPRTDEEREAALAAGYDLEEVLDKDRLVSGRNVFFAATGVTDGEMLDGVHFIGPEGATTESISMRSRSGTVRTITARHDRTKLREIIGERLV